MGRHLLLILALLLPLAGGTASAGDPDATWQSLRPDVFPGKEIEENSPVVTLTAPARAEDAAMVPVDIAVKLPEGAGMTVSKLTLIVDENPAPVAATFSFGPGQREVAISTRLRVNSYSNVRAIAETSDGALHMAARFVKASGGCSAPALKDPDAALANIGQMRLKILAANESLPRAQLMIRHPNYSGLQMDQVTRLYIPAKFVNNIVIKEGDALVFRMEGGISLSEDPTIAFSYAPTGKDFEVDATDTDGRTFSGTFSSERS